MFDASHVGRDMFDSPPRRGEWRAFDGIRRILQQLIHGTCTKQYRYIIYIYINIYLDLQKPRKKKVVLRKLGFGDST